MLIAFISHKKSPSFLSASDQDESINRLQTPWKASLHSEERTGHRSHAIDRGGASLNPGERSATVNKMTHASHALGSHFEASWGMLEEAHRERATRRQDSLLRGAKNISTPYHATGAPRPIDPYSPQEDAWVGPREASAVLDLLLRPLRPLLFPTRLSASDAAGGSGGGQSDSGGRHREREGGWDDGLNLAGQRNLPQELLLPEAMAVVRIVWKVQQEAIRWTEETGLDEPGQGGEAKGSNSSNVYSGNSSSKSSSDKGAAGNYCSSPSARGLLQDLTTACQHLRDAHCGRRGNAVGGARGGEAGSSSSTAGAGSPSSAGTSSSSSPNLRPASSPATGPPPVLTRRLVMALLTLMASRGQGSESVREACEAAVSKVWA